MDDAANQMDEDCKRFRSRLLARRDKIWTLPTGSCFERPLRLIISDLTDVDVLVSPTDLFAIPPEGTVPSHCRHGARVLTICTSGVPTGFANLTYDTKNGKQFFRRPQLNREEKSDDEQKLPKGPAVTRILNFLVNKKAINFLYSLSQYDSSWKHMTQFKIDEVEAIHCPCWPPEAAEWVTRKRENSWPSSSDINKVVNIGCHFVAKPHQSNPNDATQWRFSFSQAELILIHSWTDVQMQIYHLLRLVKSEVVKSCGGEDSTVLCTYFFKTLMLWACEEKPREFWEEMNLETSVVELIATMVEWLIDRRCPNYFIPSNNMIDYLSDDIDLSKEIELLLHQGNKCVRSLLKKMPNASPYEISIELSNKFLINSLLSLIFDNVIDPLYPETISRVLKYLTSSEELSSNIRDLHSGILTHLKMALLQEKGLLTNCQCSLASVASEQLEKAMEWKSVGNTEVYVSLSDTVLELFKKMITRKNSKHECSRIADSFTGSKADDNNISIIIRLASARCMKDMDDYLPTPLFAVAASYRANFLFSGLMCYKAAIQLCDEATNWSRENKNRPLFGDHASYHNSLSLLITSEWSVIFDKQVQIVFGFVSLYRKYHKESISETHFHACEDEDNFVLRLCAEEFLDYIRYRCQLRLGYKTDHLKRPLMTDLKINPLFTETHFRDFSTFFVCAAASIGLKSDLDYSEKGLLF